MYVLLLCFRGVPSVGQYSFDLYNREISSVPDAVLIDPLKGNSVFGVVKVCAFLEITYLVIQIVKKSMLFNIIYKYILLY